MEEECYCLDALGYIEDVACGPRADGDRFVGASQSKLT